MFITQTLQSRFAGANTLDQVLAHQFGCVFDCQLQQGHQGTQQLADVGHRECGQLVYAQLCGQRRITGILLAPSQLGLGDEPSGQTDQRQLMFPSRIFLRSQFVPACFTLGLTVGTFDEMALAFARRQTLQRRVGGCVRERVVNLAFRIATHHPPLRHRFFAIGVVQMRRALNLSLISPRSVARTRTRVHGVLGSAASCRTSTGRCPLSTRGLVVRRPLPTLRSGTPTAGLFNVFCCGLT
jgi:hypothetical protein